MLVFAANPCPCGQWSAKQTANSCSCRAQSVRDYRAKLTGPVADRIDITRVVGPISRHDHAGPVETSAVVRLRVEAARARQHVRYDGCSWRLNAHVPSTALRDRWPLSGPAARLLGEDVYAGRLSSRGAVRVHRLAWTIADLVAVTTGRDVVPGRSEYELARQLRLGEPVPVRVLEQRRAG